MITYVRPVPVQASFMFKTTYNDKIWLGLNFRTQDAFGLCLGLNVNERLAIGYGYDYSFGLIKGYNGGSHELMLSFTTTSNKATLNDKDEELNNSIFEDNKKNKD